MTQPVLNALIWVNPTSFTFNYFIAETSYGYYSISKHPKRNFLVKFNTDFSCSLIGSAENLDSAKKLAEKDYRSRFSIGF